VFLGEDSDKCFFISYYPQFDTDSGKVIGFERMVAPRSVQIAPHGWGSIYNTNKRLGYWSEFSYEDIYADRVCDLSGNFLRNAYIGNYTRTYHEIRKGGGGYEVVTNYEMPATYFEGLEDTISPL
jgi:hypothetical protein